MTENNERQQEQKRVDFVIEQIDDQINEAKAAVETAHNETRAVEKNYSANASVNLYEIDDAMDTNVQIQQQRQLVARTVENETILKRQLTTLQELQGSPYFGRIDIKDDGDFETESLYIGVASLMDNDQTDFLIYDWRAPISGIYYNGSLGKVEYPTPNGPQKTELTKKRQFTINDGKITNMFDTNDTVGDEMLQAALGSQNDQLMQNIVATIQKEQNDIIRDTTSDLLLVHGAAGSGKTSAILQRIAYLLYHSRASLNADQIVLFSPNRLFSHYISEVLPSLGERNMRQVTFAEFLTRRFEGLTVETLFEQYEAQHGTPSAVQEYLESPQVMQQVEAYTAQLTAENIEFIEIQFEGQPFFHESHIRQTFATNPENMSIADKILATKNALIKELKLRIKEAATATWIQDELEQLPTDQLRDLYGDRQSDDFDSEDEQLEYLGKRWATNRLRVVYDAIYNNHFIDSYSQYREFLDQLNVAGIDFSQAISDYDHAIEFHQMPFEHCAPALYLRDLITGSGQNRQLEYVFIDEMQDYSVAALIYLKHIFPKAKFTVLGDSEQALYSDIEEPEVLLSRLSQSLNAKRTNLISLNRSYRSTTEITNFAKSMLPDGEKIIPFSRHGELPKAIETRDEVAFNQQLSQEVSRLAGKYDTIAILTRTMDQANQAYRQLRHLQGTKLLTANDRVLPTGILVMPIYLAKGLEFDAVIAYDASKNNYPNAHTAGILYTISSRAMHKLTLISLGSLSPIVANHRSLISEQ